MAHIPIKHAQFYHPDFQIKKLVYLIFNTTNIRI